MTTNEYETLDAPDEIVTPNHDEAGNQTTRDDPQEPSSGEQPSIESLQAELTARDERVSGLEEQVIQLERELSTTVSRYRLALLDTAPDVPGDLVSGDTAEALEASLDKARGVVEQVRTRLLEGMESASGVEGRLPGSGIPAGAPVRSANGGIENLSPRDKIAQGLERL